MCIRDSANTDDGSCCFVSGCTDSLAFNYNSAACYNDGTCINSIFGCTNTNAMNFDSTANTDDGSCILLADKEDLFFSEYGEGSSNNKYLEIYNSTSNPVNLSSYALTRVSNAPTTVGVYEYWVDFDSAAVILANDVYIISHSSADSIILAKTDMTYSSLSNGDDGFALVYGIEPSIPVLPGNEYVILDYVGDFNGDPGSGWDVAGISEATKDHVLVRKCDINIGNTNWSSSAGTDSLNSEWTVLPNEDWSDIGQHTSPCLIYGCTGPTSCNYNPLATIDDGSCYGISGCMDPVASNYDPNACIDDGSCVYNCGSITGVNLTDIIHDRATFNWDNMNSSTCDVDQIRFRYREVGTSSYSTKTMGVPVGSGCNTPNTSKLVLNLTPNTTYEYDFKIWYCNASTVNWHASGTFTTAPSCVNVSNVTVQPLNPSKVRVCWDSVSTYAFVRLKYRVDSAASQYSNIGGSGVYYPILCKDKNGLIANTDYRLIYRTWCSSSGGPYRSPQWDGPVFFSTPSVIRSDELSDISSLDVYPNPSRDVFNVEFISESKQSIEVRLLNLVGEIIFTENLDDFQGKYTHSFNLENYSKGIYLLELDSDNGIVNKKLILQ